MPPAVLLLLAVVIAFVVLDALARRDVRPSRDERDVTTQKLSLPPRGWR